MSSDTLQGALEALYGLERRRDKLGLEGTRALLAGLGHPERAFRAVHVAGTNGKGTTCALIERVLRRAGFRTGLFTSPHLVDFRERIRVNGRWADDVSLMRTLRAIEAMPGNTERTFFEVATALGFADFAERGVEWAVVEVGLGGRLDTTNVLTPEVCAITSIGLDHTEILGGTLFEVAREKAGILKPGVPAVTSAAAPEALAAIESTALAVGAPLVRASVATPVRHAAWAGGLKATTHAWGELELEILVGGDQRENASCALAALEALVARGVEIPAAAVGEGFREARWPGRFEFCPREPRLWWDGAHNAPGAQRLADSWREAALPPALALALAVSRDKDAAAMLDALAPIVPSRRLFAAESESERALPAGTLAKIAIRQGWRASVAGGVPAACRAALAEAGSGLALLAGSLFAVGEAMAAFGGAPGEEL